MKKLLGSTLALAMFLPAGANAELLKNLKVGGQLDVQTTSARNITDFATRPNGGNVNNDRLGHANTRLMVKGDFDMLDDVHGRITLVKGASNHATRVYGAGAQNLDAIQTAVVVEEAFAKVDKLIGGADLTAGRQFYGEPGDLIVYFGPRDNYGQTVSALDAFRADWSSEHMNVTAIAGKTADTVIGGLGNAATDLRGVVVSCTKHENVKPSAYLYNRLTHATGGSGVAATPTNGLVEGRNSNLYVVGAKAKITSGAVNASVEAAKNFGEDRATFPGQPTNFKGYAVLGKAALKVDLGAGMVTPWAEFGMGTGDSNYDFAGNNTFQSIATDYRPGAIYGRFDQGAAVVLGAGVGGFAANGGAASNGLSNRIIWGGGVKFAPGAVSKLTVGGQFYRYAFHRMAPDATGDKASRNIGSEIDVTADWKHSENVSVNVAVGTFLPGAFVNDIKRGTTNDVSNPAVMASADLHIKF